MAAKLQINLSSGLDSQASTIETNQVAMDPIRTRYFDLTTGEAFPQGVIEDRIRRTSEKMDRLTVELALDLFFLKTHYIRPADWTRYLRENLSVSRGYAYDVDKVLTLLVERYGGELSDGNLGRVQDTLSKAGIGRLKLVAQVRDESARERILSAIETGKNIHPEEILASNRDPSDTPARKNTAVHQEMKADALRIENRYLRSLQVELISAIEKAIEYREEEWTPDMLLEFNKLIEKGRNS